MACSRPVLQVCHALKEDSDHQSEEEDFFLDFEGDETKSPDSEDEEDSSSSDYDSDEEPEYRTNRSEVE